MPWDRSGSKDALIEGCRQITADGEREMEAEKWAEERIHDAG
jgi:hypothetical protein